MSYHTITRCRSCGSEELTPLFSLGEQHVSDFVSRDRVHAGPRVPIDLVLCRSCTLVQQKHTAPQDFLYTRHYWYRSGVTQTMRDALADVAEAAQRAVSLQPGDVALDIGSNDGTLLRSYTANRLWRVGVEPALNMKEEGSRGVDMFINDFWRVRGPTPGQEGPPFIIGSHPWALGKQAKCVTACGMFYDLESPNDFIADVAKVLAHDGIFVAQLMCLKQTLERCDVGNFCHEHLEFYSLKSLVHLFGQHRLEIFDIEENDVNGGSYRLFVRHKGASVGSRDPEDPGYGRAREALQAEARMTLDDPRAYADFFRKLEANKHALHNFILSEVAGGKRVHVLGASTKGNVILQWADLDSRLIEAASDRSPDKWDRYTVGTGIPIVSEEQSREMRPDYYLCLPYAFRAEMLEREQAFRERGGRFLFPLPTFEVV